MRNEADWILTDTRRPKNRERIEFVPAGVASTVAPLKGVYREPGKKHESRLSISEGQSWYFEDQQQRRYREGVIRWRPLPR